ncbi:MAG: hypothetical protein AAGA46_09480 [Cyanobacteria bacterium P01_F01_bin.13]
MFKYFPTGIKKIAVTVVILFLWLLLTIAIQTNSSASASKSFLQPQVTKNQYPENSRIYSAEFSADKLVHEPSTMHEVFGLAELFPLSDQPEDDLDRFICLQEEFAAEMVTMRGRVDTLEADVAELEAIVAECMRGFARQTLDNPSLPAFRLLDACALTRN